MTRFPWLREPLVHFLAAGAALFVAVSLLRGPAGDARTIAIDRDGLFAYLQSHAELSDPAGVEGLVRAMAPADRERLYREVALQEALYRESAAIGLDKVDPLIRQRMIQQMRQLIGDEAAAGATLSEAQLSAYHSAHAADYRAGDRSDFAHVFFATGPDAEAARQRALAELARLRAGHVTAAQASARGERFLYERRFAGVGEDELVAKFGEDFARALARAPVGQWVGPLRSEHGWHLVLVTARTPGRVPTAQELGPRLREDALADLRERKAQAALDALLARYTIRAPAGLAR